MSTLIKGKKIRLTIDFSTEMLSLKCWKKITGHLEFYNYQEKVFPKWRENNFQSSKSWKNLSPAD